MMRAMTMQPPRDVPLFCFTRPARVAAGPCALRGPFRERKGSQRNAASGLRNRPRSIPS